MKEHRLKAFLHVAVVVAALAGTAVAQPPGQTQAEAAAAKKAQADAQAEKEKRELAATMDAVAARWRAKAAANGWPMHPPTAVAPVKGLDAPAVQSSPSGQPGGRQGSAALQAPKRSEKTGTAPPSADVKTGVPSIQSK
jgi:hypothetical protein